MTEKDTILHVLFLPTICSAHLEVATVCIVVFWHLYLDFVFHYFLEIWGQQCLEKLKLWGKCTRQILLSSNFTKNVEYDLSLRL